MRCLVTGVAGFIGSHLADRLLADGHDVVGVDAFTTYYSVAIKRRNLETLLTKPAFRFVEADLSAADLAPLVRDMDWIFHLAGQPGVRDSWGASFQEYVQHNIQATQRLLEATREQTPQRLVYASSSSVYGDAPLPMDESVRLQPLSPYGVTKLAGEQLMRAYWKGYGVPTVAMRFFTVYGPRQRPDMAFNKFIRAIAAGEPISLYGDGSQTRDFTYVEDIVEACVRAATTTQTEALGAALNIGGGSRVSIRETLEYLGEIIGRPVQIEYMQRQRGDAAHTIAATELVERVLEGWRPQTAWREGLQRQVEAQTGAAGRTRMFNVRRWPRDSAPREPHAGGKRLAIYGHDTFGLGHLRRNLTIAQALTQAIPDLSVLLITGSPSAGDFPMPERVDYVKLPAVVKVADERYESRTLDVTPAEMAQLRAALIREAVAGFAPDVLLVDHAPLGMKGEMLPALREARQAGARVALGLRDIVDEPERVRMNWRSQRVYSALEEYYDAILVYGAQSIVDVTRAYEFPPELTGRTHYCGYLQRPKPARRAEDVRAEFCPPDDRLVLVTAGGGGDGYPLLHAYLTGMSALAATAEGQGITSVIVTGPFMASDEIAELARLAQRTPNAHLMEFTGNLPALMQAADLVVSMGGYNTLCELISVGAPALVAPRAEPRQEQLLRARAFARLGLISLLEPDELKPQTVTARVRALLADTDLASQVRLAREDFAAQGAMNGIEGMVKHIARLLAESARPALPLVSSL